MNNQLSDSFFINICNAVKLNPNNLKNRKFYNRFDEQQVYKLFEIGIKICPKIMKYMPTEYIINNQYIY